MKHYKLYKEGDKVLITFSHSGDTGKIGIITEVRHSFCKIKFDTGVIKNYTYAQFHKC